MIDENVKFGASVCRSLISPKSKSFWLGFSALNGALNIILLKLVCVILDPF